MSATINAFEYTWNPLQDNAQPGIAISNRGGRFVRVHLRSAEETFALIDQLIELAESQQTWEKSTHRSPLNTQQSHSGNSAIKTPKNPLGRESDSSSKTAVTHH